MNNYNPVNICITEKNQQQNLLKELIEYKAASVDDKTSIKLLKTLIDKYTEAEKQLIELNNLKNKFLAIAAHDLRNPVLSVKGFSELLLSGGLGSLNEEQQEIVQIIAALSKDMSALINDLLDIAIIESGKLELTLAKSSFSNLITQRVQINQIIATRKNITIKGEIDSIPLCMFDESRITQVIDNLISNAIKFSPRYTTVRVSCYVKNSFIIFSVEDEGPGISSDNMDKLFKEFSKAGTKTTAGEKSTGLGLAIVKKIIETHKGFIEVESEVNKGSKFSFRIPLEE